MNAPRDVPAPDLQLALRVDDAGGDAPEKKGDIVILSDNDAPDASDALGPRDASGVADVGVPR
jgi:hypothetical protein